MASTVAAPTEAAVGRPRAVFTRVQVLGLLMGAAVQVLFLTAAAVSGQLGGSLFLAVPLAVLLLAAGLAWRYGTAGKAVGIAAILALGGMMWWTAFGLMLPASFTDFVGGVLLVLAVVLGLGGGIAALVAQRRHRLEADATRSEARILRTAVAIVALAIVGSGIATVLGRSTVSAAAATGATNVGIANFAFEPATITTSAADGKVLVHNGDAFAHDFTVPALGMETVTIPPGSDHLFTVNGEPGTYTAYCTLHSDTSEPDPEEAGMAAALTLE